MDNVAKVINFSSRKKISTIKKMKRYRSVAEILTNVHSVLYYSDIHINVDKESRILKFIENELLNN